MDLILNFEKVNKNELNKIKEFIDIYGLNYEAYSLDCDYMQINKINLISLYEVFEFIYRLQYKFNITINKVNVER